MNIHGAVAQPVTLNVWIEPISDPQSVYGVDENTTFNE